VQKINGKFHILGTAKADDLSHALMYVAYPDGSLDTLVTISSNTKATSFDNDIDSNDNIVSFNRVGAAGGFNNFMKVVKFDEEYNIIWAHETETASFHLSGIRGVVSEDNVIFSTYTPPASTHRHTLRSVDMAKNEIIICQPEQVVSNVRGFSRLKTLNNGGSRRISRLIIISACKSSILDDKDEPLWRYYMATCVL
jgi:hypothetical protein